MREKYQEARAERLPDRVYPMLASESIRFPSDSENYAYEPKLDGIRVISISDGKRTTLRTRSGMAISENHPAVVASINQNARSLVLDGELCALDEHGVPRRQLLVKGARRVVYYPFDLLYLDGFNLMDVPYEERREIMEDQIQRQPNVIFVPSFRGEGMEVFEETKALGFEGMIAKRLKGIYTPGVRSKGWIKIKPRPVQQEAA
jgi:bifunctional non-homologous end joining protein LigD